MSYTITCSEDKSYILIKVVGKINRKSAMKFIQESHTLGKELGISHYLVDAVEARNTDTISNNYDFAYHDMKENTNHDRYAKVVFLVAPDDHSHDFIETVLLNVGMNVTIFRDRNEAIKFLQEA